MSNEQIGKERIFGTGDQQSVNQFQEARLFWLVQNQVQKNGSRFSYLAHDGMVSCSRQWLLGSIVHLVYTPINGIPVEPSLMLSVKQPRKEIAISARSREFRKHFEKRFIRNMHTLYRTQPNISFQFENNIDRRQRRQCVKPFKQTTYLLFRERMFWIGSHRNCPSHSFYRKTDKQRNSGTRLGYQPSQSVNRDSVFNGTVDVPVTDSVTRSCTKKSGERPEQLHF
jgi:hypothetical protein